ncbi:hypothetical protein MACH09_18910 [Vibrio sp. MACH09]|uniref:hypothetical protein n=1 Tax=Vibrio sp. MACH09 TaxID=3025122 RepID=UPI00278CEC52|nr:hypothetical protein [Vibrio sp. MACH09]GLO61383.1 hypothetical protein MACH09_18910 [Vibrio sp. MACH09]
MKKTATNIYLKLMATILTIVPLAANSSEYSVGFGPITLGDLSITSSCEQQVCQYKSRAKGSFLFIDADVEEQGVYKVESDQIVPVYTSYEEEIGSNHRSYSYDFRTMEMKNRLKNTQESMEEAAYPFTLLLQQVTLDIQNNNLKRQYTYLLKQKIKPVDLGYYETKTTEDGIRHYITVAKKKSDLEFVLLQQGGQVKLEKLYYGNFWLTQKRP